MENEILTIEEAAEYLQIGKRSIYKLAKAGKIPCRKILNKYRFVKEELRNWVKSEDK
ncbi:helix-turn-helix domain-containing protein [Thermodesulfobacteriota bacterium]